MNAAPHPAPNRRRARPWREWALTLPSLLWLAALFLLPTALVAVIALKPPTPNGGIGPGWTLDTLRDHMLPALRPSFYPLDRSGDVMSWDPI